MFDLSKEKIDLNCEKCNRKHTVTIRDVMNEKTIHCSCGTDLQLKDSKGSAKKGVREINDAFKKLEKAFKF